MAANFASFTVLFCLLCFSTLSTAVDLPAIDQKSHDLLPESNTKSDQADAIFLPSERLGSQSAPVIESLPVNSDSEISKPDSEGETLKPTESSEASDSIPIMTISFRPINRHMPWHPMKFPAPPGHRCRHNHKFKPWNPRLPRHQIPYGNDMILSNGQEKNFDVLPDDRIPKIPMRWTRLDLSESRFADEPGMERIKEVMMRRYRYHHERDHDDEHDHYHDHDHKHDHDHDDEHDHHHERDHDHDDDDHDHHHDHDDEHDHHHDHDDEHDHHPHHKHEHDREHDHHHERDHEEGGLMKSIRKFLQHF